MYFNAKSFGERVALQRSIHGMTQEELAERLGVCWDHISKMERGKKGPSIDTVIALACIFKVSTDYLLVGKESMDPSQVRADILDVVANLTALARNL